MPKHDSIVALAIAALVVFLAGCMPVRAEVRRDSMSRVLDEVVIRPKKEKYSKKNNPALDLMRYIRNRQDAIDPRRNDNYNYDKYERITIALNDIDSSKNGLIRAFPLLKEHLDTSEVSGRPILNVALREKASHVSYRRSPKAQKEYVTGLRHDGIDDMIDPQSMKTFYEDIMREIDIYDNDITILQNRFVGPLSRIAPDFYKYYLTDTVAVGADTCVVLSFVPRNSAMFGFTGKLYVLKGDTTGFIRKAEMQVAQSINLNFIDRMLIRQEFDRAPDGSRLKTVDEMIVEAGVLSSKPQLYSRRVTALRNHNFQPAPDASIWKAGGDQIISARAYDRDEAFWDSRRFVSIQQGENSVGTMMDRLRTYSMFYWTEKILKILVTGYVSTGNPSKWDYGPVNTTVSANTLEGARFRVGGMTTANLSPRWFTRDYVAYGVKDRKFKYSFEVEYSFRDKRYHSREFPVHSLRATHLYDVDMLGQHYLFTNPDNVFLSLKRAADVMMTYHRVSKLQYICELENNFSVEATVKHERQEQSPYIRFYDGLGNTFSHYTMSTVSLSLRYAPGEKFFQTRSSRLPVNLDAPVIMLTHTWGPRGWLGNRYALSVTELSFQKRFWFSAFGYLDAIARAGHVWTRSPFPNLLIPNANLSYTIQPESFAMMNPLEFVNDSYASVDLTYWANGAIFNYVPLLKQLKWREVFSFRGLWGHLSDRNNPAADLTLLRFPETTVVNKMTDTPYMEVGVGIDNIFRFLRLDYVWRLTYRDALYCPKFGLRLALHFTF